MKVGKQVFRGRETEPEPQRIVIGTQEWTAFCAACERISVDTSATNYWAWRLREAPFRD